MKLIFRLIWLAIAGGLFFLAFNLVLPPAELDPGGAVGGFVTGLVESGLNLVAGLIITVLALAAFFFAIRS
ncbi:hypothetical protein [Pontivivens ytuae]|uniref:Uncharacterized protein n=1 Tax=Pontivivens ytuae TaxID=2789856 RepID=A0A7S9QD67_9RHOB|nr:hypothetical protein [Pontivivens ytuae]QPH54067.1 hypothetical protein I0K15_20225 [Pontivivens ytuae]